MRLTKALVQAIAAVFAITAFLGTANASAAQFTAASVPATIGSGGGEHEWMFHSGGQYCPAPPLAGTMTTSPVSLLQASAEDVTCTGSFVGQQMKMNGCEFTYRPGAETQSGTFKGAIDIGPPGCGPISFDAKSSSPACKVTVPAQKALAATYKNVAGGDVEVIVGATGLQHTQVSGYHCGGALGTFSNGKWSGSWTLQGSDSWGPVNMAVEPTGGFELPPAAIAIGGTPPYLAAGTYPMTISGESNTEAHLVWSVQSGNVRCGTVTYGTSVTAATAQFPVTPKYEGCTGYGLPATVNMNGCTYAFSVLEQAPAGNTYAGHSDIACPEGKSVTVTITNAGGTKTKCTITIPAQTTDSEGLSFTNEAATSTIGLGMEVEGVDYHQQAGEGLGACMTLDSTTGTLFGSTTLIGSY